MYRPCCGHLKPQALCTGLDDHGFCVKLAADFEVSEAPSLLDQSSIGSDEPRLLTLRDTFSRAAVNDLPPALSRIDRAGSVLLVEVWVSESGIWGIHESSTSGLC